MTYQYKVGDKGKTRGGYDYEVVLYTPGYGKEST